MCASSTDALYNGDRHTFTLAVPGLGPVIAAKLPRRQSRASEQVGRADRVELITGNIGDFSAGVVRALERVRVLATLRLVLTLVSALAALALSRNRRRTVGWLALGATCVGITLLLVLALGREIVLHQVAAGVRRDAAGAVWGAFLDDLHGVAWIITAAGVVIALVTLPRPQPRLRRGAVAAVAALLLGAAAVVAFAVAETATEAGPPIGSCLGHAQLCGRSLFYRRGDLFQVVDQLNGVR